MKHWTEPNGIFLIHIPIEWQYLNQAIEGESETSPYSFQSYEDSLGCFQLSCYPLAELAPTVAEASPNGVKELEWKQSRMDDSEFCAHIFYGALGDQALIGKFIYDIGLENDKRITNELAKVSQILNSIVVVPSKDRKLASDLDKFDRFTGALAASHDLLHSAIESESYIEVIAICANLIDAYLRLSIVIAKQLSDQTDSIETKYLFQADHERGIMERKIFNHALEAGVGDQELFDELDSLYQLRNRVIHRYIISNIKTRDLLKISSNYLTAVEKTRLILRDLEDKQATCEHGVYGRKFKRADKTDNMAIQRLLSEVNDKHLLDKFNRKFSAK
ncbi:MULTISPECIES: hypothetical protein [Shewanella]|uniref:hypothetical protein n=2 Tax=Shewanella algae TaxID=38313 RepID=UPI0004692EB2|nr:hypothetical protein [Shewanella algae]NKZ43150.1 hypothetical protein [Shewanella algae]QTE76863.1 hypothetical protein E1N14_015175 [Shewanella algae]